MASEEKKTLNQSEDYVARGLSLTKKLRVEKQDISFR